jgi:hypothetical protein
VIKQFAEFLSRCEFMLVRYDATFVSFSRCVYLSCPFRPGKVCLIKFSMRNLGLSRSPSRASPPATRRNGHNAGSTISLPGLSLVNSLPIPGYDGITHSQLIPSLFPRRCSGFAQTLVVLPLDRVKTSMQADTTGRFTSPLNCARHIFQTEGVCKLLFATFTF